MRSIPPEPNLGSLLHCQVVEELCYPPPSIRTTSLASIFTVNNRSQPTNSHLAGYSRQDRRSGQLRQTSRKVQRKGRGTYLCSDIWLLVQDANETFKPISTGDLIASEGVEPGYNLITQQVFVFVWVQPAREIFLAFNFFSACLMILARNVGICT